MFETVGEGSQTAEANHLAMSEPMKTFIITQNCFRHVLTTYVGNTFSKLLKIVDKNVS